MTMTFPQAAATIALVMLGTLITRFLPFLIFRKQVPHSVRRLGAVLPCPIMGMLVVYCLKDVTPLA